MSGRISGREFLVRMSIWLLFLLTYAIGLILYDWSLLSPDGLTRMVKILAYTTIPAFLLHQWILNRRKKTRNGPKPGDDGGQG